MIGDLLIGILRSGCHILDLTVSSAHEALGDDDVIAGRVATKSCSILADDIDIVEQLSFNGFQNQNIHVQICRWA